MVGWKVEDCHELFFLVSYSIFLSSSSILLQRKDDSREKITGFRLYMDVSSYAHFRRKPAPSTRTAQEFRWVAGEILSICWSISSVNHSCPYSLPLLMSGTLLASALVHKHSCSLTDYSVSLIYLSSALNLKAQKHHMRRKSLRETQNVRKLGVIVRSLH